MKLKKRKTYQFMYLNCWSLVMVPMLPDFEIFPRHVSTNNSERISERRERTIIIAIIAAGNVQSVDT